MRREGSGKVGEGGVAAEAKRRGKGAGGQSETMAEARWVCRQRFEAMAGVGRERGKDGKERAVY